MEETFDWSQIHIKQCMQISGNVVTLFLQKDIRGKFITRKLTKEESFPSLSVRQNRAVHVHKNVKHFIPQHSRVQLRTRF